MASSSSKGKGILIEEESNKNMELEDEYSTSSSSDEEDDDMYDSGDSSDDEVEEGVQQVDDAAKKASDKGKGIVQQEEGQQQAIAPNDPRNVSIRDVLFGYPDGTFPKSYFKLMIDLTEEGKGEVRVTNIEEPVVKRDFKPGESRKSTAIHALHALANIDDDLLQEGYRLFEDEKMVQTFLGLPPKKRRAWLVDELRP